MAFFNPIEREVDEIKFRRIADLISCIQQDWTREDLIEQLQLQYSALVVNVAKKVSEINRIETDIQQIVEDSKSFFLELLWEYDTTSPVQFTRYLKRKLYFRLKNYYEKQNGRAIPIDEIGDLPSTLDHVRNITENDLWKEILQVFEEREIDMILCSELLQMKQREIGSVFDMVQPTVSTTRRDILNRMNQFMQDQAIAGEVALVI